MKNAEWILCPIYGNKTRIEIRDDTVLENVLLFCLNGLSSRSRIMISVVSIVNDKISFTQSYKETLIVHSAQPMHEMLCHQHL